MTAANDTADLVLERRAAVRRDRLERFRRMLEIRAFEDRIQQLFLEGHVDGTTHTCQGQEAVSVGLAAAIRETDTVACTYRGHGHALALGLNPERVMGEILGRTSGCMGGLGGSMHLSSREVGLLPTFAIVGAGVPIAAGVGLSAQVRGTGQIGVGIFGDGAANIGAFHEGLNLAAIWKLPVIYLIENNVYGEYSRYDRTTPIEDLAARAGSYGIPGSVVDGQDVDAVQDAVAAVAARAREGGGPSLLEMKTYRYAGHSRSDQALYRPPGELEAWKARDPIDLLQAKLVQQGAATKEQLEAMRSEISAEIAAVAERVLATPKAGPSDMFRHIYAVPNRVGGGVT
jgi:acetoin:2,6-dichlorophenolindophenol oxidoreductase subunit alpha